MAGQWSRFSDRSGFNALRFWSCAGAGRQNYRFFAAASLTNAMQGYRASL